MIFAVINRFKKEKKFNYVLASFFGGVLMGLTVAPINLWWLAWVSLIPLWLPIRVTNSWLTILGSCLLFAVGFYGISLSWILGIHPMTWMGVPWLSSLLIAILCWLLITGWGVILVIIWGVLVKFLSKFLIHTQEKFNSPFFAICFGIIIWCLLEKIWSYSPLWWTSLAFTQSPYNLSILQLLKLSGITTVTSIILLVNFFLAELIILASKQQNILKRKSGLTLLGLPFIILLVSHSYGYFLLSQPLNDDLDRKINIGIIQGNIPNEIKLYPQGFKKAIAGYTKGYEKLADLGVDIVLTPETALPFFYQDIKKNSQFYQQILIKKTPVWLGAFGKKDNNFTNSLFLINGQGKLIAQYDKTYLVPVGEYIPFSQVLGNLINRLSPLEAQLIAGDKNQIFPSNFGQTIVAICYESAFPQHFRQQAEKGGEFIITSANNAHYSPSMPFQHHAQDVMRGIETDRWIARATNTGYSAIVNPHGETIWLSKINQYQIHQGDIYRRQTKTFYVRWGDWLIKIFIVIFFLELIFLTTKLINNKFT